MINYDGSGYKKTEGVFKIFKTSEIDKMNEYINSLPVAKDGDGWPIIMFEYTTKNILIFVVKVIEK